MFTTGLIPVFLAFLAVITICITGIVIARMIWPNRRDVKNCKEDVVSLDKKLTQVLAEFKVYDPQKFKDLQAEVRGIQLHMGMTTTPLRSGKKL